MMKTRSVKVWNEGWKNTQKEVMLEQDTCHDLLFAYERLNARQCALRLLGLLPVPASCPDTDRCLCKRRTGRRSLLLFNCSGSSRPMPRLRSTATGSGCRKQSHKVRWYQVCLRISEAAQDFSTRSSSQC